MKFTMNKRICYNPRGLESSIKNNRTLSYRIKKINDKKSIIKSKKIVKDSSINRSSELKLSRKKKISELSNSLYISKALVENDESNKRLYHKHSTLKLSEGQRRLIDKKNFVPKEVSFNLLDKHTRSTISKEQDDKNYVSFNDFNMSCDENKKSSTFHKRRKSQSSIEYTVASSCREFQTIAERIFNIRKKSLNTNETSSSNSTNKRHVLQNSSKDLSIESNSIFCSQSLSDYDKPVKDIKYQEKLKILERILYNLYQNNSNQYTFLDFLGILQTLRLISKSVSTSNERILLAKSWHLVSFYHSGEIVSNYDNIKLFISGILGCNGNWLFEKRVNRSFTLEKVLSRDNISNYLNHSIQSESNGDYKVFKFASYKQLNKLRCEFKELNIPKYDLKIQEEGEAFDNDLINEDISPQSINDYKFTIPCINIINPMVQCSSNIQISPIIKIDKETDSTITSSSQESYNCNKVQPALNLDVFISDDNVEKLYVLKTDSPSQLADEFSIKHNLTKEKRDKLVRVIKYHLNKILTCISEEDEEAD